MKRTIATIIGVTCCAGSIYANDPAFPPESRFSNDNETLTSWSLNGESATTGFLSAASPSPMVQALPIAPSSSSARQDLGRLALRISYVGSLLLTADHIIRSVDSVLDGMQVSRPDGTHLQLLMEPGSRGVDVMLRMSRPLDF